MFKNFYLDILTEKCKFHITPLTVYIRPLNFNFLSLENDVMETSKRCALILSLIFILQSLSKFNIIRIL